MKPKDLLNLDMSSTNQLDADEVNLLFPGSFERDCHTHSKKARKFSLEDFFSPSKNAKRKLSLMECLNADQEALDFSQNSPSDRSSVQEGSFKLDFPGLNDDSDAEENSLLLEEKLKRAFNVDDFGFSKEDSLISLFEPMSKNNFSDKRTSETFVSNKKDRSRVLNNTGSELRHKLSLKSPSFTLRPTEDFFDIKPEEVERDGRKTLIIKNIPVRYSRKAFLDRINKKFISAHDYFYMPLDAHTHNNLGYAFINMVDFQDVRDIYKALHGKKWKSFRSNKVCEIKYARIQGKCEVP